MYCQSTYSFHACSVCHNPHEVKRPFSRAHPGHVARSVPPETAGPAEERDLLKEVESGEERRSGAGQGHPFEAYFLNKC